MAKHSCPSCSSEMTEIKSFDKRPKDRSFKYKVKKYKCGLCGHEESIYGGNLEDVDTSSKSKKFKPLNSPDKNDTTPTRIE